MPWGRCRLPRGEGDPELDAELVRILGGRPRWASSLSPVPWVARGMARLSASPLAHADRSLCDQITLIVSRENSCRYCYGVQRALLKISGQRQRDIDALERSFELGEVSAERRFVLDLARKISRGEARPSSEELEVATEKLGRLALFEIVFVAAGVGFSNRVATFLLLPPESTMENLAERRWVPLKRWIARRVLRRPLPPPLGEAGEGPCASVLAPMVGLPCGTALASMVAGAFAPSRLPVRTKLLMVAIVGRALGCPIAERETERLLLTEGVSAAEREQIVAHLGQRSLDRRESALLRFARDSIRYRFDAIQRSLDQLESLLTTEELVEAVGVASLANLLCRVSVLTGAC